MSKNKTTKKDLIFDAAFQLFVENGYENTKIADIAKRAGIGKGTIYEYFESKDELFAEMLKLRLLDGYMEIQPLLDSTTTSYDKLSQFAKIEESIIHQWSNIFAASPPQDTTKNSQSKVKGIMAEIMLFRFNVIKDIVQNGMDSKELKIQDPYMATAAFLGALNFYVMCKFHSQLAHPGNFTAPFQADATTWDHNVFINMVLDGLRS